MPQWAAAACPSAAGVAKLSRQPREPGEVWLSARQDAGGVTSLLAVIGVTRLARTARARWEPVSLAVGVTLTGIGFALPAAAVAYLLGLLILIVALITGIAAKGRAAGQAADCWQWRG